MSLKAEMASNFCLRLLQFAAVCGFSCISLPAAASIFPWSCFAKFDREPIILNAFKQLDEADMAKIRERDSSYYSTAKEFAATAGREAVNLALDFARQNPDKKVNVVVPLGGAEHLGNLVKLTAEKEKLENVRVVGVYLTTNVMQLWSGYIERQVNGRTVLIRTRGTLPPDPSLGLVITDPQRPSLRFPGGSRSERRRFDRWYEKSLKNLQDYLKQARIFETDHVVVLDTGLGGSAVNVISQYSQTMKQASRRPSVEGVLVYHEGARSFFNFAPVRSVNNGRFEGNFGDDPDKPTYLPGSPRFWASMLDNEGPAGLRNAPPYSTSFQRSHSGHAEGRTPDQEAILIDGVRYRLSPSYLRRDLSGRVRPGAVPFSDDNRIQNYVDTMLGLSDGLTQN